MLDRVTIFCTNGVGRAPTGEPSHSCRPETGQPGDVIA